MLPGRRARRIRERGAPATATVLDAAPAGGGAPGTRRWRLRVRVQPQASASFEAALRADLPADQAPGPGWRLEVLHDGRRAVPAVPAAAAPPAPPAPPAPAPGGGGPPPAPAELAARVMRLLAQGELGGAEPRILVDEEAVAPAARGGEPDAGGAPLADLVARARTDPDGVAAEVRRRLAAGETTPARLWRDAHALGPEGAAAARAVLAALAGPGADGPPAGS